MAKGGILEILGVGSKEPGAEGVSEEHRIKVDAMSDFLEAVKAKDADGMASAFERAYEACAKAKKPEPSEPAESTESETEEY